MSASGTVLRKRFNAVERYGTGTYNYMRATVYNYNVQYMYTTCMAKLQQGRI